MIDPFITQRDVPVNRFRKDSRDEGSVPAATASSTPGIQESQRVACVLTGHPLKDPNVTVNYHKDNQGPLSNAPVEAPNDLEEIIKLIR